MITQSQIDAGAEALRQRQMSGKITRPWSALPNSDKRKWREHAEAVLRAAIGEDFVRCPDDRLARVGAIGGEDKMKKVDLLDLLGEHTLDGVDLYVEAIRDYGGELQDAEAIRFRLDGVAYTAIEDPSDGYRSSLGQLFIGGAVNNSFPPVRVLAMKKPNNKHGGENDTLLFVDLVTGKIVLEVGTDNTDDYYTSFVSSFSPENMATNASTTP